ASETFRPVTEQEKQKVRIQYAGGEPYFLFVGALHPRKNLKSLLKAFQIYRERGNKGKLLIVGANLFATNHMEASLVAEEFRSDVHFTGHLSLEELAKVTASALALVFVPYFEGFGIPLVEAMRCGTPIIAGNLTSLPEVVGDAGILVNPFDTAEIATQMQRLFVDEQLQKDLSEKGLQRAPLFNWDFTANAVWSVIEEVGKEL
ncbi:MAG: glycosyltransferase family 4 protein, partial [Flavobacteriia bacterium]|nr:glycosyltransferase family 4 protein [Flavobacteriia bacterium]